MRIALLTGTAWPSAAARSTGPAGTKAASTACAAGHLHEPVDAVLTQLFVRSLGFGEELGGFRRPRLARFGELIVGFGDFFLIHGRTEGRHNEVGIRYRHRLGFSIQRGVDAIHFGLLLGRQLRPEETAAPATASTSARAATGALALLLTGRRSTRRLLSQSGSNRDQQ